MEEGLTAPFRTWTKLRKDIKARLLKRHALQPRATDPDLDDGDVGSGGSHEDGKAHPMNLLAQMLKNDDVQAMISAASQFVKNNLPKIMSAGKPWKKLHKAC